MRSRIVFSLLALVASCASASGRTDGSEPADGKALLARMHDRYAKRWFQTLTFVQRTTQQKPDGTSPLPLFPTPDKRVQDVRLENNVAVGDGWLATRVRMLDQGKALQTEEYSDWRVNVPLPATFFQVEHWTEGQHWASGYVR